MVLILEATQKNNSNAESGMTWVNNEGSITGTEWRNEQIVITISLLTFRICLMQTGMKITVALLVNLWKMSIFCF